MPTRIKRYEAELTELDALLARIESEMGPSAQLETREFTRGGVLGVGGVRMVEIIATLEVDEPARSTRAAAAAQKLPAASRNGSASPRQEAVEASRASREQTDLRKAISAPEAAEPEPLTAAPRQSSVSAYAAARNAAKPPPGDEEAAAQGNGNRDAAAARERPRHTDSDLLRIDVKQMQRGIDELKSTVNRLLDNQQRTEALAQDAALAATEAARAAAIALGQQQAAQPVAEKPASLQSPASTAANAEILSRLHSWNIAPQDAQQLLEAALATAGRSGQRDAVLQDEKLLTAAIAREICRSILLAGGIVPPEHVEGRPPYVVALVGPTGVGKTTTVAKLAAQFAFQQGKRVCLASLDNYRIAAAEQLRTYAEIIGLPLDIVFSAEEFSRVIDAQRTAELMLVDTAGRSPLNEGQIAELAKIFDARRPDEVHLVVASTTKSDDLQGILEGFAPLRYKRIIISKLDETRSLGCLYNINQLAQVPISYFAVGQSVPEDLRPAQLSFIQSWIEQGRIA